MAPSAFLCLTVSRRPWRAHWLLRGGWIGFGPLQLPWWRRSLATRPVTVWAALSGGRILERYGRWVGYSLSRRTRVQVLFDRWGSLTVFITRTFLSYLSSIASLLAGITRFRLPIFLGGRSDRTADMDSGLFRAWLRHRIRLAGCDQLSDELERLAATSGAADYLGRHSLGPASWFSGAVKMGVGGARLGYRSITGIVAEAACNVPAFVGVR